MVAAVSARLALRLAPGLALMLLTAVQQTSALDNGLRVPPMGWSSWYGFTQNINETMLREMGEGMISSGLHSAGYEHVWLDDGWAVSRDPKTGHIIEDRAIFPSGMKSLVAYIHSLDLKFGIYTSKGNLTCLGYQSTQPKRPGSCGFEDVDANVYAHEWQVDQVKDDGCGQCPHNPWTAMRDALNKTGRRILYAIHAGNCEDWTQPVKCVNGSVANMWRTGGDLSGSSFDMWTNRLDLATLPAQRALAGPGSFPNPDFLEVGYSPRAFKGRAQSLTEQRSMFTLWAALPGPLILSADLRKSSWNTGRGLDEDVLKILTNKDVIAVNQDPAALPMEPVRKADGLEVWKKPLSKGKGMAVVLFHRNSSSTLDARDDHGTAAARTVAGAAPAAPPVAHVGAPVSMVAHGSAMPLELSGGAMRLKDHNGLCLGALSGLCKCSNPPSPRVGVVACNESDRTQHWLFDAKTGQVNNDAKHDLNSGPVCKGDSGNSMLLYPTQGHHNEQYQYQTSTGLLCSKGGGQCLGIATGPPAPAPPPPAPAPVPDKPRAVSVTWAELGLAAGEKVLVRDLWAGVDLGVKTGSFSAEVVWRDAQIYTFVPQQ